MNLYEIREAIRTETDEARLSELLIERDRLRAEEMAAYQPLDTAEWHDRMLDYTFN